jgi:branched-chain amino acid transport system substrate-binding protein
MTQNIYLREVAATADGTLYNKEIQIFEKQPDPGLAAIQ